MQNLKVVKKKNIYRLVYKGNKMQDVNMREYNAIQSGEVSGLIPFAVEREKKPIVLSSDISRLVSVQSFLGNTVLSKKMFSVLIGKALDIIECVKINHFDLNLLVYDPQMVFIDPMSWDLYFIYIPMRPLATGEQFKDFFKGIIQYAAFDQTEDFGYVQTYIDIVNQGTGISLFTLREFLKFIDTVYPADSIEENNETTVNENAEEEYNAYLVSEDFRVKITKTPFRIGKRREISDYRIDNKAVSREHADIILEDGYYYIIDLDSTNGTFINGRKIESGVKEPIYNKDAIRIANEEFTLVLE